MHAYSFVSKVAQNSAMALVLKVQEMSSLANCSLAAIASELANGRMSKLQFLFA